MTNEMASCLLRVSMEAEFYGGPRAVGSGKQPRSGAGSHRGFGDERTESTIFCYAGLTQGAVGR